MVYLIPIVRRALAALTIIAAVPFAAAQPAWLKLEADTFVLYTDATAQDAIDTAVRYAAYRQTLDSVVSADSATLPPTTLVLFNTASDYRAHLPAANEKERTLTQHRTEVDGVPVIALAQSSDTVRAFRSIGEAETTWALQRLGYQLPLWMSQGTAKLLSTASLESTHVIVGAGVRSSRAALKWPEFFEITQGSQLLDRAARLNDFTSQSQQLMHWILLRDERGRARFHDLAARLHDERASDAVAALTNTSADQFSKAIEQHLKRTPSRALPFDRQSVAQRFQVAPAREVEVLVVKADLLAAAEKDAEANRQLDRARELAPDARVVKEAWARRFLREGKPAEAIALYREAIAAGSKNAAAYLRSAEARLEEAQSRGPDVAGRGGSGATNAIAELRQALHLNPGSAEAYRLLGRAFYLAPEISPNDVDELSRRPFVGEDGQMIRLYRAALYTRLDRFDDAVKDLRTVIADPEVSRHNRELAQRQLASHILSRDSKRVDDLIAAQDYAAARAIVAAALANNDIEPLRADFQQMAARIDELEAWAKILAARDGERWSELRAASRAFADRFPESDKAEAAKLWANLPARPDETTAPASR